MPRMFNERMRQKSSDITEFTQELHKLIMNNGFVYVRTRDASIFEIYWKQATDDCESHFAATNKCLIWDNDGSSLTSRDLDLFEILEINYARTKAN